MYEWKVRLHVQGVIEIQVGEKIAIDEVGIAIDGVKVAKWSFASAA